MGTTPKRIVWVAVLLAMIASVWQFQRSRTSSTPVWIWTASTKDYETVYFRRLFQLDRIPTSATLIAAADDEFVVYLNGKRVLESNRRVWPISKGVSEQLIAGQNLLAVRARNRSGQAGVVLQLDLNSPDGSLRIVSDTEWLSSDQAIGDWYTRRFNPTDWKPAVALCGLGVFPFTQPSPEGFVNPMAEPAGPPATAANTLTLPPGFHAELLHSVPKHQGSWVSMTADPAGRLLVSAEQGDLYRITVKDGAKPTLVEPIELDIGQANGLAWAFGSLYAVVNGRSASGPGLYRIRDSDGNDSLDEIRLLTRFELKLPGSEHGPHGIVLGPAQQLYVVAGNRTPLPASTADSPEQHHWPEDVLLERGPAFQHHGWDLKAPAGWVCRTDSEGSRWKVLCTGLRNAYDIAFNQHGELFTSDSDMESDEGMPWYRPARINHCVPGAEFGWRSGTAKWPPYFEDSLDSVATIGRGSPTGMVFGTATRFPPRYQRALFVGDWANGTIFVVHLNPQGASYSGEVEPFVTGTALPITDLVVGSDGCLYFVTGGRGSQSGLYRVSYTGTTTTALASSEADGESAAARRLRRDLESTVPQQDEDLELVWQHLDSPDRVIRFAARVTLERCNPDRWAQRALSAENQSLIALMALARTMNPALSGQLLSKLCAFDFSELQDREKLVVLRAIGLTLIRSGQLAESELASLTEFLDRHYPALSPRVNRELARLLTYLNCPSSVAKHLRLLATSELLEDQIYYGFLLSRMVNGWTSDSRRQYVDWLDTLSARALPGEPLKELHGYLLGAFKRSLDPAQLRELNGMNGGARAELVVPQGKFQRDWRLGDLSESLRRLRQQRSFSNGEEAFVRAACSKCHRIGLAGSQIGPDLAQVAKRFNPFELLESILDPSKVISDQYVDIRIETDAGRIVVGRIEQEDGESVTVRLEPLANETVRVPKTSIRRRRPSPVSSMPNGLLNNLSEEDILDLLAYILSGGDPGDAAFTP